MADVSTPARRLAGTADLVWIAGTAAVSALVTGLLLSHLRVEFETYRVANARAGETQAARDLDDELRGLELELQHRLEAVDVWQTAAALGMAPPTAAQLRAVAAPVVLGGAQ